MNREEPVTKEVDQEGKAKQDQVSCFLPFVNRVIDDVYLKISDPYRFVENIYVQPFLPQLQLSRHTAYIKRKAKSYKVQQSVKRWQ